VTELPRDSAITKVPETTACRVFRNIRGKVSCLNEMLGYHHD